VSQNARAMPTPQERVDFSARLRFALKKSAQPIKGATDLARLFNLKHRSSAGVTVQTTHKWLTGRAIPTTDKIETLAEWLEVNPHWLHYGPAPESAPAKAKKAQLKQLKYPPSSETLLLAKKIEALPEHQRYLVAELVTQFYGNMPE
jgi:transcriptional regulator with XRE-family HTH domain